MDEAGRKAPSAHLGAAYPNWISAIDDQQARTAAELLYTENQELARKQEDNLKFISSLRSQGMVQQERVDRLERKRTIAIAAIGGGLGVTGLAALLISYYPTLGIPLAIFLLVLLGRACFPALLDILKAGARNRASDRF